ncbi:hypothetical protein D3C81_2165330 [compost metagenome]
MPAESCVVGKGGCGPVCAWAPAVNTSAVAASAADSAFRNAGLKNAVLNNVGLTGNNFTFFSMTGAVKRK